MNFQLIGLFLRADACDCFYNTSRSIFELIVPKVRSYQEGRYVYPPWFDNEIITFIRRKNADFMAQHIFKKNPCYSSKCSVLDRVYI